MKNTLLAGLMALGLGLAATASHAITIGFQPAAQHLPLARPGHASRYGGEWAAYKATAPRMPV